MKRIIKQHFNMLHVLNALNDWVYKTKRLEAICEHVDSNIKQADRNNNNHWLGISKLEKVVLIQAASPLMIF